MQDAGMNIKEAREAPLEAALKHLHRAIDTVEAAGSLLEQRLARLMWSPLEVRTGVEPIRVMGDRPEQPRAEMTQEISQFAARVAAISGRLEALTRQLDC